ncbi:threonine synthase [uncultured Muriicola sp.]|uniref:threonine synthase n=1 Tax=uncultured Muriicola sp. TaxID=1583102 RepID=UPI0026151D7F|nr:threonine synthase [uncultured Muriicola sp.]
MNFYSLHKNAPKVSFKEAVINGIAPDGGLYFPEQIPQLPASFFDDIQDLSNLEIAYRALKPYVKEDIPEAILREILEEVLDFDFPLVPINENVSTLELFHGPTMAFKDVGARFMARSLGYFFKNSEEKVTVLVATSGDTGGAVANGFLGVAGVEVVILYPSGKVSDIQERQLTTLGQNITALQVNGTFDDCQRMVKRAFVDPGLQGKVQLTSANSINVARWLPQMLYYLFAYKHLKVKGKELVFSVPSGNFGNICAGMIAQRMGMPVRHFIASTNVNDTVPKYMQTAMYDPKPSTATISNAMDVGDPSNFIRIQHIYNDDFSQLKEHLSSYSFSDKETKEAIKILYAKAGYIADPHGAVGYLGLRKYQKKHPETYGIFLETAHPVKFMDVVSSTLNIPLSLPPQIEKIMHRKKVSIGISKYEELAKFLLK